MTEAEIGYLTDNVVKEYVNDLRVCRTAEDVRQRLVFWPSLTDAREQAENLTDEDWRFVIKNRRNEGDAAKRVNEIAGAILIPRMLLDVLAVVKTHQVLEGTAFIRLKEVET